MKQAREGGVRKIASAMGKAKCDDRPVKEGHLKGLMTKSVDHKGGDTTAIPSTEEREI